MKNVSHRNSLGLVFLPTISPTHAPADPDVFSSFCRIQRSARGTMPMNQSRCESAPMWQSQNCPSRQEGVGKVQGSTSASKAFIRAENALSLSGYHSSIPHIVDKTKTTRAPGHQPLHRPSFSNGFGVFTGLLQRWYEGCHRATRHERCTQQFFCVARARLAAAFAQENY